MSQAKSIRWIVIVPLALLLALLATWHVGHLAKHTKFTPVLPRPVPERTVTEDEMIRSILAQAARRGKGVTADAAGMWVSVANTTPVSSINRTYRPQESCFIKEGGKVVLQSIAGDQMLLRYAPRLPPSGSNCPDGTLFFITAEKVAHWSNAKKDQ